MGHNFQNPKQKHCCTILNRDLAIRSDWFLQSVFHIQKYKYSCCSIVCQFSCHHIIIISVAALSYICWSDCNSFTLNLPHIFSGASSSRRIGWLKKISRDFRQRFLISLSVNCTFLPGLLPRTRQRGKKGSQIYFCLFLVWSISVNLQTFVSTLEENKFHQILVNYQ